MGKSRRPSGVRPASNFSRLEALRLDTRLLPTPEARWEVACRAAELPSAISGDHIVRPVIISPCYPQLGIDSLVRGHGLCYTFVVKAVFKVSAFKHGYRESDFYEVLASRPIKRRSLRGVQDVYELFGQNLAGEYLHILYRRSREQITVFHMNRMTKGQKAYFRKYR